MGIPLIVNTSSGIGVQDPGIRVHDGSESVFRMVRNTHLKPHKLGRYLESLLLLHVSAIRHYAGFPGPDP